jgi:hypothetical protein
VVFNLDAAIKEPIYGATPALSVAVDSLVAPAGTDERRFLGIRQGPVKLRFSKT